MSDNKNNGFSFFMIFSIIAVISLGVLILLFFKAYQQSNLEEEQSKKQVEQPSIPQDTKSANKQNLKIPPLKTYNYIYVYEFTVNGYIKNFDFEIMLPDNENNKQLISDFVIEPKPNEIVKENGNLIARYNVQNLSTGLFKIVQKSKAKVRTYNINTAKKINQNPSVENDLTKYLKPEKGIESRDEYIINIANKIKGENKEKIIENTYKYILNHMEYKITNETIPSAKKALQRGYGQCSDNSAVMVAILRAKNIPARIAAGNIAREHNTLHNWVEVYFDEYGWVTYDPTIQPTVLRVYGPNKKLIRTEKRYDISHDEVQYIQSAINTFSTYKLGYSTDGVRNGSVQIKYDISIKPAD